jgi:outer membrane protein assembly factor BamB
MLSDEQSGLTLAYAGENLLKAPGFEGKPEACPPTRDPYAPHPEPTDGWEHNGLAGKDGAIRAAAAHGGQGAWELIDTMSPGEPALLQRVAFRPEYRGHRFVFSVWARTTEGTNDQARIALKFSSSGFWRGDEMRPITVGPEWRQYTISALLPEDADELGVVIGPSSYEGQGAIIVDDAYLAQASYATAGTYTSPPHDMGEDGAQVWRVAFRAETPTGTRVSLLVRTGKVAQPDASWSRWERISANPDTEVHLPPGRYVQYEARLSGSGADVTPVMRGVQLSYGAHLAFVAGRVAHAQSGAPVAHALVRAGDASVTTDPRGEYVLGVKAGPVEWTVTALHYLAADLRVPALREGQRIRAGVELQPDPTWATFRGGPQRQGYSALTGSLEGFGVAWEYPLGTVGEGQVVPADLDGDGRSEFVVARGGSLSAWRLNGDLMWQLDGWEIGSILGVYDLLANGEKQVIGLSTGWQPYANGAFTVVSGRDGKLLSRVDTWPDAGDIGHGDTHDYLHGSFSPLAASSCVVADLDRDGKLEIMVHPNYHSALMAFDFHDGLTKPKMMWKTQHRFRYDLYLYPLLGVDVDGDGGTEIVYHDESLIRIFDGRTGEEKSAADMGCPRGLFGPMACGDVAGDGTAEVVLIPQFDPEYTRNTIALAGWDGKALVRRWTRDFDAKISTRAFAAPLQSPLADVDGDRQLEVIVRIGADTVVLNGIDGAEEYRIPNASLSECADLNGDGVAEIVAKAGEQTVAYNGQGGYGPKDVTYPATWGWSDWGDGNLCRLRGAAGGRTEVVNRDGQVKASLPGAAYRTTPIVADLQGDGKAEIVLRDAGGILRVLEATSGRPVVVPFPELKCDYAEDTSRGGGITARDLDGDGKAELVLRDGGHLVVANADGSTRFRSEPGGLHFPAVGHFDHDGIADIACDAGKRWIAFSGKEGRIIWEAEAPESNEVATWDTDGDGCDELTGKMGPVFLLSGADGHTMWTAFRKEQCALGLGVFADLNGDEVMEALATGEYTNTAWYPNGASMWWIGWSSGGAKEHYGAVADVNADGAWDYAVSSNHGVLYCVDGRDGHELWTFRIPEKVSLSHCAAADLDSDRRPEFVFGTNTGRLMVVNGEDGSLAASVDLGAPAGEPIVADANGDHRAEVLVVAGGRLLCLGARQR